MQNIASCNWESAVVSPERLTKQIKPGMSIFLGTAMAEPGTTVRHLFYRFSEKTVYYRYFQTIRSMPHAKMQEYVNVDWNQVMSIVGLVSAEGKGRIIAEARYIKIPGSPFAEVVFVVDEIYQRLGIGSFLYRMLIRLAKKRGIKGFVAEV
jgi:GNAT superfamily N-acetyltransferase